MTVIRRGNVLITLDDNVPLVSPPTGITDQLMAMAKAADAKAAKA